MIVVSTPTGNIGKEVVKHLLAANESVRVIARDPLKLAPEFQGQVEVAQGAIDDGAVMLRALKGAESFFLVVPPSFATHDVNEYYMSFTRPLCRAIKSHGLTRVVAVSGIGRGVKVNAGPVTASLMKDEEIEQTGVHYRALWCPGFMENMLRQVRPLKQQGLFAFYGRPDQKRPLVATRDIAASGAKLLIDRSWTGQSGLAVLGPEDLSFDEMAVIMTEVLGKPIRFQEMPANAYKAQLVQLGATEAFAQSMIDMLLAKDQGLDHSEPRTPENTTPTGFRPWCEEVLKPVFNS
jgi:uncharacterized protein YbjT (DUF2867 family)